MRTLYVVPVDLITLMENNQSLEIVDTEYAIVDIEMQNDVNINWTEILVADPDIAIDVYLPHNLSDGVDRSSYKWKKKWKKGHVSTFLVLQL